MPWKETSPVDERVKFIAALREGKEPISHLCEAYGVSRKTAYKWIARYEAEGPGGLVERSRRPLNCANQLSDEEEQLIIACRKRYPTWGARKIRARLEQSKRNRRWPAVSTIHQVLKRNGLTRAQRRRRSQVRHSSPLSHASGPNDVWCADFKGDFNMQDVSRCYPLTISDAFSRYLLRCRGMSRPRFETAWPVFESAFKQYGLPAAIRTDNGPPFASQGGLSQLSVWWIRLGIRPERIEPGKPQQNGRHERMHRTLKLECLGLPAKNMDAQNEVFDEFLRVYNDERPHEAIGLNPPASLYRPSPRPYPNRLPAIDYPPHFQVRWVANQGCIRFDTSRYFISECLIGEPVGLEAVDDGIWHVFYGSIAIGRIDERTLRYQRY